MRNQWIFQHFVCSSLGPSQFSLDCENSPLSTIMFSGMSPIILLLATTTVHSDSQPYVSDGSLLNYWLFFTVNWADRDTSAQSFTLFRSHSGIVKHNVYKYWIVSWIPLSSLVWVGAVESWVDWLWYIGLGYINNSSMHFFGKLRLRGEGRLQM